MTGDDGAEPAAAETDGGGAAGADGGGAAGAAGADGVSGSAGVAGATGSAGATEVLRAAGPSRNPWSVVEPPIPVFIRDRAPDPVNDPDEVTVQNDVGSVRIRPTGPPGPTGPTGSPGPTRPLWPAARTWPTRPRAADASGAIDGIAASGPAPVAAPVPAPVFVDESGRRSRRFRRIGMAVGLVCAVYAVVIVATLLSGSSDAPWLPVPGQNGDRPAGRVDDSPRPSHPSRSSDDGASVAGPPVNGGTTPSAGASPRAPGAGTGTARPSASASARPTSSAGLTGSSPKPGSPSASASPSAVTPSSDAPASPASSPPPVSPSESAAPTGGPVAQGAAPHTGAAAASAPAPVL
ncbi:hypothetical protein [Streptomyces fuscichromogenes]|uniref:Uncharacterized protein n=1 Tax=Streptomyces fuscichromogenes TaxID=1324013 RepID=A0A917XM69_9ACTN|nr:hypothetical protein [Streptomyces fuscichromogenes]GGN38604.1 hypothetical protein GCM10011578_084160 [Streptomyces fuscichromogenes]